MVVDDTVVVVAVVVDVVVLVSVLLVPVAVVAVADVDVAVVVVLEAVVVVDETDVVVVVDGVSTQVSHSTGQFRRVTAPNNALLQNESSVPHACGSGVPLQASVVVIVVVFVVGVNVVLMQVSQSTGHRARRFSPMKSCRVHLSCKSQSLGSGFPLHVIVVVVVDVVSMHVPQSTGQVRPITAENPAWVQNPTSTSSHDSGSGSPLQTAVVVVVVRVAVVVTHVSHSTGQFCFATAPKKASSHSDASEPHALPSGSPLHVGVVVEPSLRNRAPARAAATSGSGRLLAEADLEW